MELLAPRRSPLTLLAALSGLLTLALVGALIYIFVTSSRQPAPATGLAGNSYITTAQSASGVDTHGSPIDATSSFAVGQQVYIAYTVTDAGPGTAIIKLYDNGVFIDTFSQTFARRSSYTAYFTFPVSKAGAWEADLYWRAPGAAGDGALEQKVTFLVGDSAPGPGDLALTRARM